MTDASDELFWDVAAAHLAAGAERSTMMGHPCLRIGGDFFASMERDSGDLIAKLPADRVEELVDDGTGVSFAPSGRRFKEWLRVPTRDEALWTALLDEARAFVAGT